MSYPRDSDNYSALLEPFYSQGRYLSWMVSGVDSDTEELMQGVISNEFQGRTIINIVHKVHNVLDYDRVLLLDEGRIMEIVEPRELATRPTSAFYSLLQSLEVDKIQ
jgi:ABC-type multidrug transport system fused ATPase/permease subunit